MRAIQQVPDKKPGYQPPQRSYGGRATKDKPQPPQASSQHWKREGRTQGKAQERASAWTIQRPEAPSENPGPRKVNTTQKKRGTEARTRPTNPRPNKRPRKEIYDDKRRGCGQRLKRQDGATEHQKSRRRGHKPVTKPPQPQKR